MAEFVHPETGELLATEAEWKAALTAVEERLAPLYRLRRVLRTQYAESFSPAVLPERTRRTPTQELVARCPRCGLRLETPE